MTRQSLVSLLLILAIAAIVRFWGLGFGLPHTDVRPDENFVILVPRAFLAGNFKPAFYDYPWLYMWALTLVYLGYYVWGLVTGAFHAFPDLIKSWPVHWEPFFLLNRGLSATLGTATVAVVFWIGRRLWTETTGLVAAFFLSVAFLHVRDSHFGTTDVAMTFLVMVAIALLIDSQRTGKRLTLVGAVSGLAAATKYNALLLAVPVALVELWRAAIGRDSGWRSLAPRLMLFSTAFLLALLVGIPFVLLDTNRFLEAMAALRQAMQLGQGQAPASGTLVGWLYHLQVSLRFGLGVPLLATGLVGMLAIIVRTPAIGLLLFSFPIAYYAVAGSLKLLFVRYALPCIPFLCLSAAWVVCTIAERLSAGAPGRRRAFLVTAIVVGLSVAVAVPSALAVWQFDRLISRADNRVVVGRWINAHVPPNSSVLQSGSAYGHAQFDPSHRYQVWVWDRREHIFKLNKVPAAGQPDWILLQESPLPSETQPVVKEFLTKDYVLVQNFVALSIDDTHVYDQQDAFFVPVAGFAGIERPGPNFAVFRRAGAAIE